MIVQNEHDKQTLQEYLHAYTIRKKIEERKKSKSKGKDPVIVTDQQHRMNNVFATIDSFMNKTKIQLEDFLLNSQIARDKILFYLQKLLDDLSNKLKSEIAEMYKDVYRHYLIQRKEGEQGKINTQSADYFKQKMINAAEQNKKSNLGEVLKENFKKEERNTFITKLILGETFKDGGSPNKDNKTIIPKGSNSEKELADNQKNMIGSQSSKHQQEKNDSPAKTTDSPNVLKKQAPEPRVNSFLEALLGVAQEKPKLNTPVKNSAGPEDQKEKPKPTKPLAANQLQLPNQKDSKISRPFERKTSIKEIMNSPKGKRLFKAASPY